MVDNKSMELEALNSVKHKLQKYGHDYADLSCDRNGVDLYAFQETGKGIVKVIKVQSKGRNIIKYTNDFNFHNGIEESLVISTGKKYNSDYQFTYNSYVEEIQYGNDSDINGFHLYIGDKEEKYNIYLLRDGRYGVIKNK